MKRTHRGKEKSRRRKRRKRKRRIRKRMVTRKEQKTLPISTLRTKFKNKLVKLMKRRKKNQKSKIKMVGAIMRRVKAMERLRETVRLRRRKRRVSG